MLDVIDKGSSSESHPVPLLFVHAGEHAAWCWDEHFVDYFAAKGYRALALSLRGHGMSSNSKPPRACSIADYAQDVSAIADPPECWSHQRHRKAPPRRCYALLKSCCARRHSICGLPRKPL
jgi:hypothetical protein